MFSRQGVAVIFYLFLIKKKPTNDLVDIMQYSFHNALHVVKG